MGKAAQYTITFIAGMGSLLAGASVVHSIFLPDISIPVRTETSNTVVTK